MEGVGDMLKTILIYLVIGASVGVVVAMLDLPIYVVWIILIAFMLWSMGRIIYVSTAATDLRAIEKFVDKHQKDPVYAYLHKLRDGTDDELKDAVQQVLQKHKNGKYHAAYGMVSAMLEEDFEAAQRYNNVLLPEENGRYNATIIQILAGNELHTKEQFSKPWMNTSIEAHQAYMKRDAAYFRDLAQEAVEQTKGVQRYINHYSFQRMMDKLI